MRRHEISDDNWSRIEQLLPGRSGGRGGVAKDNRGFVNAIWYVAKTGIPWRDLPERFGKWDTAFHRFNAWCKKGVWRRELLGNEIRAVLRVGVTEQELQAAAERMLNLAA